MLFMIRQYNLSLIEAKKGKPVQFAFYVSTNKKLYVTSKLIDL